MYLSIFCLFHLHLNVAAVQAALVLEYLHELRFLVYQANLQRMVFVTVFLIHELAIQVVAEKLPLNNFVLKISYRIEDMPQLSLNESHNLMDPPLAVSPCWQADSNQKITLLKNLMVAKAMLSLSFEKIVIELCFQLQYLVV